ncbi:MAG: hypothetical protein KDJ31_05735 [Candidatus Competibacteraceae bacterium]|nr:hypothetical protein [Candidatus Competibacteraceae bacterium]
MLNMTFEEYQRWSLYRVQCATAQLANRLDLDFIRFMPSPARKNNEVIRWQRRTLAQTLLNSRRERHRNKLLRSLRGCRSITSPL